MAFDPFADPTAAEPANDWPGDQSDEAQTEVPTFPTREAAVQNVNDKLSVTLKYEGGFDQPWVVLKATSVDEMNELLAEAGRSGLLEAVAKTAAYTKGLNKPQVAPQQSQQRQGGYGNNFQQGQPAASQGAPNGQGPSCAHGPMKYASGINKQGNPYSAFFCTLNTQDYKQKCPKVNA